MRSDLIALAERCEVAEGPSRELDAAMMLVPENMPMWAVTSRNSATVGNKDNPLSWRFAATPALALTAACLRAIAGESHD